MSLPDEYLDDPCRECAQCGEWCERRLCQECRADVADQYVERETRANGKELTMTDTVTYDEHRAFLNRLVDGALAEYAGFSNASIFDEMIASYSTDPRIQARYQRGFEDGKAMVLAEKEAVR